MTARLGLGMAALGRPEYLNVGHGDDLGRTYDVDVLRAHAHRVLDAAWDAGVRHLDAARSYGAGEEFVGSWLAGHSGRRTEVTVGSKWGYTYVARFQPGATEHEVKDHTSSTLERQWPETLDALGGPPDLYLVHSLTVDSPALDDGALLDRLAGLAAGGVRVGLSTSGPTQAAVLRRALALDGPFSTVQATWNLLEPSAGDALAEASARGWVVVVKEAVANGRLARSGVSPALDGAAAALGVGHDAVAIAAALAQPWADVVLSGASTVDQLHANLRAADVDVELEGLAQDPAGYWAERSAMTWS